MFLCDLKKKLFAQEQKSEFLKTHVKNSFSETIVFVTESCS